LEKNYNQNFKKECTLTLVVALFFRKNYMEK